MTAPVRSEFACDAASCLGWRRLDVLFSREPRLGSSGSATTFAAGVLCGTGSTFAGTTAGGAAGTSSETGPRCFSMRARHCQGKTISPRAVKPIGVQPPGGISSCFGSCTCARRCSAAFACSALCANASNARNNRNRGNSFTWGNPELERAKRNDDLQQFP